MFICLSLEGTIMKEKHQINIYKKETKTKIGSFLSSSKDFHKAFYHHVNRNYAKYKMTATECFWKISDIGTEPVFN